MSGQRRRPAGSIALPLLLLPTSSPGARTATSPALLPLDPGAQQGLGTKEHGPDRCWVLQKMTVYDLVVVPYLRGKRTAIGK